MGSDATMAMTGAGVRGCRARTWVCAISLLPVLAGGCATMETVREARGQGVTHVYYHPFGRVFDAALAVARKRQLEVVETDRNSGRLMLAHGVTLLSWGERIAIFLKPVSQDSTQVEIVSKAVMPLLNFPPDWERILLGEIEVELQDRR